MQRLRRQIKIRQLRLNGSFAKYNTRQILISYSDPTMGACGGSMASFSGPVTLSLGSVM